MERALQYAADHAKSFEHALFDFLRIPSISAQPEGQPVNVSGQWEVKLDFMRGSVNHSLVLEQDGGKLMGTHHGE